MYRCPKLPLVLAAALSVVAALPAAAQDRSRKAATSLYDVDDDFSLQGEYYGQLFDDFGRSAWKAVGLQVVALGDGEFQAVLYPGGLPGDGWDEVQRFELNGSRSGGTVDLWGDWFRIVVENEYALVHASTGQPLGQIAKVNRVSPTLGAMPPWGSRVLFDGSDSEHFVRGRMTLDGLLKEGTWLQESYRDYTLHLEFRLPYMPHARGQGRSNSGVYLQSRYEVQILDSFGLEGEDNECAGLYKFRRPDVNMCLPPLAWQTYDIEFRAPRFDDDGNKIENARISVWHNGVAVHSNVDLSRKTGAGAPEGPTPLPIRLQDHGNPVRFRNIWIVDHSRAYPQRTAYPRPPVADPGVQYGTVVPPFAHYRSWQDPLPPRKAPAWFYYPQEAW